MNWELTKRCVVPVETLGRELRGTAFFISAAGHALTCAHVGEIAGGWQNVRIKGQPVIPVCVGSSTADDFAVVQVAHHDGTAAMLSTTINPMDRFLTLGFGRKDFPMGASVDGTITDVNNQSDFGNFPMIRLRVLADSQQIREGFSGAPIFNTETDRVVGIMAAYDHTQGGLGVPISTVIEKWPALKSYLSPSPEYVRDEKIVRKNVFISYRSEDPDITFAQHIYEALKLRGHQPFMAGESLRLGDEWPNRISAELGASDFFVLLLSQRSATSDMVTEEVKRAKHLYDTRIPRRPAILPIRIDMDLSEPLNYDLSGYLSRFQQRIWRTGWDQSKLVSEIIDLVEGGNRETIAESDARPLLLQTDPARPLPIAEPELPEGQVGIVSQFYIERPPIEDLCKKEVLKPGCLIRIRAPRQMGKTSLLARILEHARKQGYSVIPLSLQLVDSSVVNDLGKLLKWLAAFVSRKLKYPNKVPEYWDDFLGHKGSATAYFEEHLLVSSPQPVVLALDEADRLFDNEQVAADFFGMLRGWHELAKDQPIWSKLRLIVVHSTEVYISLGVKESPFNVGLPIRPLELTAQQITDLADRHGYPLSPDILGRLLRLTGGHPYLTRVALYSFVKGENPEEFFLAAGTEQGRYSDHLRRHLWNLEQNDRLFRAMQTILAAHPQPASIESMEAFKLESMGLITRQGNGSRIRFQLYTEYFRERLEKFK